MGCLNMEIQLALISTVGQQLTTLSGGERQRLKLAIQMALDGGVYRSAAAAADRSGPIGGQQPQR